MPTNVYTITGTTLTQREATDTTLCRISGYTKDIFSVPDVGVSLVVRHLYYPIAVGSDTLILGEKTRTIQPSNTGYISFDVLRGAKIRVEIRNRPDLFFEVDIPDVSSLDLAALLVPYILSVSFVDTGPISASVGNPISVGVRAALSNGKTVDAGVCVALESSDTGMLAPIGGLSFFPQAPGTATISITGASNSLLGLDKQANGLPVYRLSYPDITFPAPLTVQIT